MNGNEALGRFERRLVPLQSIAGNDEAFAVYRDELPQNLEFGVAAHIGQGFTAGYDAAMKRVRQTLAAVQTEALRDHE